MVRGGALAALWASGHLAALGLVLAARGADPVSLYRELLAAVAVATFAAGLISGGSYGPRTLLHELRRRDTASSVGVLVGALITVALSIPVARSGEAFGGPRLLVAALAVTTASVAAHRVWSRRDLSPRATSRPWMLPSTVTATFVATSLATMLVGLPDVYPVSSYPMYSAERGHDYQVDTVRFVGVTEDGTETGLGRPVSRQALVQLADAEDLEGLETLLRSHLGEGHPYRVLEIRRESIQIARHPDPVEVRTVDAQVLWMSEEP